VAPDAVARRLSYVGGGKRIVDVLVAALALPVVALVAVPVGIAIKREDGGPVLYRSRRVGRGMQEFDMYKFRTMRVAAPDIRNADGSTFNSDSDPRVTRVGSFLRRTSLDEVPQLVNVLKGDMSLVGPRPSPTGNRHLYPVTYLRKFEVRPGISGYNQYRLRNAATMDERMANDLYYVENLSARLDLAILLGTIVSVARRQNVNR
jgi:lipopolysaccharide/colanic/teichoic acid biosynthesis glycosyltransferase